MTAIGCDADVMGHGQSRGKVSGEEPWSGNKHVSTNENQKAPQQAGEEKNQSRKGASSTRTTGTQLRSIASLCIFPLMLWLMLRWQGAVGLIWFMAANVILSAVAWVNVYDNLAAILIRPAGGAHDNDMLTKVVEQLCAKAHRTPVKAHAVPEILRMRYQACAVSRPAPGQVFATDGLVEQLTEEELTAVLAHELSHIWFNARSWTLLIGVLTLLANLLLIWADATALAGPHLTGGPFWYSIPALILLMVAGRAVLNLPALAIHRHMERQADEMACTLGCEGSCLALALWVTSANEFAYRRRSTFPGFLAAPKRRSWTAEHREKVLQSMARQDVGLHAIVEYLVAMFQDHPSLRERTRYLLDEE